MSGLGTRRRGAGGVMAALATVLVLVLAQPAGADSPASRGASGGLADVGDDGGDDRPVVPVAVAGVAGLGLGLGLGALAFGRRRRAAASTGDPGPAADPTAAAEQRTALANALINLRDRLDSDALDAEIGAALDAAGVREVVVAAGSPFDPERHRGVDWETTHDPAHDKRVAHTERPGYLDGPSVLRPPEVVVYRLTDERTAAP